MDGIPETLIKSCKNQDVGVHARKEEKRFRDDFLYFNLTVVEKIVCMKEEFRRSNVEHKNIGTGQSGTKTSTRVRNNELVGC